MRQTEEHAVERVSEEEREQEQITQCGQTEEHTVDRSTEEKTKEDVIGAGLRLNKEKLEKKRKRRTINIILLNYKTEL